MQPYGCFIDQLTLIPKHELVRAHDSCVGLKELPSKLVSHAYFISEISKISYVLHLWWLLVNSSRVSPLSLSDLISSHQCNLTITLTSSWNWYLRSYEAKHCYELPSPTNAQFQHDSCVRLKELPSKLVSHAYLIFRNKRDISHIAPLVTFGDFQ